MYCQPALMVMAWTKSKTACAVAAAVILGTIAYQVGTMPGGGSQHLRDGTRVVIDKLSYSTHYSPPKPLPDILLSLPPASWLQTIKWSPCLGPSGSWEHEIFTFWFRFSHPPSFSSISYSLLPAAGQPICFGIADENGFEAAVTLAGSYGFYQPAGFGNRRFGLVCGAGVFPRRCKMFLLRLYQKDALGNLSAVAEFPIKNSSFKYRAAWKPEPLPADHETNGLVLTLVSARVGTEPPGPELGPYKRQVGEWSEFRFRVTQHGKPASGWTVDEMWISDGISKPIYFSREDYGAFDGQLSRTAGDEIVCIHRWDLWSNEPAWRLLVHFKHANNSDCWTDYLVRPEFLTLAAKHPPK